MHYPGPQSVDFDDVKALNLMFLDLLCRDRDLRGRIIGLPAELEKRFGELSKSQIERLAGAPFLLMSFRENDEVFWDQVHAAEPRYDLFAAAAPAGEMDRLIAAGLGFAWQLARQNPYALRLICGASLHWCERLGERPLVQVLDGAATCEDILVLRAPTDVHLWAKLLHAGVSRIDRICCAAHLSALQMLVTGTDAGLPVRLPSAACRTRVPTLSVTRKRDRSTR